MPFDPDASCACVMFGGVSQMWEDLSGNSLAMDETRLLRENDTRGSKSRFKKC